MWLLKVARPGFWLTSIWFYLLPLGQRPVWTEWTFWLGLFYVTFPLGLLIYGWNDIFDSENDRNNPRKDTFLFGARPTPGQIAQLPRWIALVQIPFVVCFLMLLGGKTLAWWAAVFAGTALYNWPRIGLKNWPIVDLLNQISYVLVFVLGSWVNGVPQLPWFTFTFGALFAMHSHLFGEIMDREPDLAAGRRTTAGTLGMVPAKGLLAGILAVEAWLIGNCARDPWISAALACGALFFPARQPRSSGARNRTQAGRCGCSFWVGMPQLCSAFRGSGSARRWPCPSSNEAQNDRARGGKLTQDSRCVAPGSRLELPPIFLLP